MLDKKTFLNKYREITKVLHKRTRVFNHKKILCNKYRKISFIIIAVLVIVNMTIFSFNVFSQMGVQEANSLESYAVVAYTDPGSHTWTVPNGVSSVDVLVVAGGGGGGGHRGGGGGAGELVYETGYLVSQGESILIEVGDGGAGGVNTFGANGAQSKFGTITANGGGGGAPYGSVGNNGGSGGGGGCNNNNGGSSNASAGYGNAGGYGPANWSNTGSAGGGGGAGSVGLTPVGGNGYIDTPGNGGDGMYFGDVFGDNYGENGWFAGGGGGGTEGHTGATNNNSTYDRPTGMAGGGDGGMIEYVNPVDPASSYNQHSGTDAVDGTGSGGGGGNYRGTTSTHGGDGGSGVVIIKYKVNLGTLQGSTLNKGLVGHWSMDEDEYVEGTENMLPQSLREMSGLVGWNHMYHSDDYSYEFVQNYDNRSHVYKLNHNGSSSGDYYSSVDLPQTQVGDVYVFSREYKVTVGEDVPNSPTLYQDGWKVGGSATKEFLYDKDIGNGWRKIAHKFTITTAGTPSLRMSTGYKTNLWEVYMDNFQFEKKDNATPFANGTRTGRLTDKTPYSNHGDTGTQQSFAFGEDRFGNSGGAMSFNGISDYVSTDNMNYNINNGDWTASAWYYVDKDILDGNFETVFGFGQQYYNGFHMFENRTCSRAPDGSNYFCLSYEPGLETKKWQLVTVTHELNSKKLTSYINGQMYNSTTYTGTLVSSLNQPIIFGWRGGNPNYFKGSIDDVRIYSRALSESEIQSLYDSHETKISAGSLNKGLVLDMPLTLKYTKDETAGSEIMTDKTPYSNDGQNYGSTITAEGASFDGVDDYIDISSFNYPSLWNQPFSLSSWIYIPSSYSWNTSRMSNVIGRGYYAGSLGLVMGTTNNTIVGWVRGDNGSRAASGAITRDNWHHTSMIWDGSVVNLYIDGELVSSSSSLNLEGTPDANIWQLGYPLAFSGSSGSTYEGKISNIFMYNRALSDTEVKSLYDKGRDSSSGMTIKPYGSVPGMAGLSCLDILNSNPSVINNNGLYWINPDNTTPFQVYCDMTTDGGGWTLSLRLNTNDSTTQQWDSSFWTASSAQGTLSDSDDYLSPVYYTLSEWDEILMDYKYTTGQTKRMAASFSGSNSGTLKSQTTRTLSNSNPSWTRTYTNNTDASNWYGSTLIFQTSPDNHRIWYNKAVVDTCNDVGGIGLCGDCSVPRLLAEVSPPSDYGSCQWNGRCGVLGINGDEYNDSCTKISPTDAYDEGIMYVLVR